MPEISTFVSSTIFIYGRAPVHGELIVKPLREAQENGLQVLHKSADPEGLLALIYQLLAGDECPESTIVG